MAAEYLKSMGYEILESNYHCRYGEIDLIVKDENETVIFIEVKARTNRSYGDGADAVNDLKRQKIKRTARQYIFEKRLDWYCSFRFDVILFQNGKMEHIVDAFY